MIQAIIDFIKQWFKNVDEDVEAPLAVNMGIFYAILFISIKGKVYGYQPLDDSNYDVTFLSNTFNFINEETGNSAKALAWLKRNSKVVVRPGK